MSWMMFCLISPENVNRTKQWFCLNIHKLLNKREIVLNMITQISIKGKKDNNQILL